MSWMLFFQIFILIILTGATVNVVVNSITTHRFEEDAKLYEITRRDR